MDLKEFEVFFMEQLKLNGIKITINNIEQYYNYMKDILDWNNKVNLTSITDEREFVIKHFIDSLTICKHIKETDRVIDIGTGAGFPGVPLKFCIEKGNVTLIDSVNKKLNVIRSITDKMDIKGLEIIHTRAEDIADKIDYRESFDIAITRAVSNIATISEYMIPFLKIGGKAICMKGPNYEKELLESKKAIDVLGGKIEDIENIRMDNNQERNIIIIKKVKATPKNYPRKQGKPAKDPII